MKINNTYVTTAATSQVLKSSDTSYSKHKRSKTHNNVCVGESDSSMVVKDLKKEEALSNIKNKMQTLYDSTVDGKYKFMPNNKIVYVTKSQIKGKGKAHKRCSSTEGTTSNQFSVKTKIGKCCIESSDRWSSQE
jgi:hypothetical protein